MLGQPTVLLVEDDPNVREAVSRILRRSERALRVISVGSGQEALSVLERERVDLLITDHRMPGMTGLELLTVVARDHSDVPAILMTAYAEIPLAQSAVNEGRVERFLQKPVDRRGLLLAATEVMEAGRLARHRKAAFDRALHASHEEAPDARPG